MKKIFISSILAIIIFLVSGCNNIQIQGLDKFSENDCCFGLNDGLFPANQDFLIQYPYLKGDYHYWRNNYGEAQAKTFVQLFYAEDIYNQAKTVCQVSFAHSSIQLVFEEYVFYGVDIAGGEISFITTYPGVRMVGYNDNMHSLVFIGYLNEKDSGFQITTENFKTFFDNEFGVWFQTKSQMGDKGTVLLSRRHIRHPLSLRRRYRLWQTDSSRVAHITMI